MVTCPYPVGLVTPVTLAVFAAHVHEHPLVAHYRATGDGSPVKISNFLSRERFHRLGLYAEFFRQLPVKHQLAVSLRNVRMDASLIRRFSRTHSTPPSAVPARAAEVAGRAQPDRESPGDALTGPGTGRG